MIVIPLQLIRGGWDGIIRLLFSIFSSKRRTAITLVDPNIKYALRLIDKQVIPSVFKMTCRLLLDV